MSALSGEEQYLYPAVRMAVPDGERLADRELAEDHALLPTRPHPATPSRPPWNKVVDPVVAMVDKARDAFSRRATYPKDL